MYEDWQTVLERVRERFVPLQHLAPVFGSGLVIAARFCSSRLLRFSCLTAAILLFLVVTADFARSLLDKETGDENYEGKASANPVTPAQVFLTFLLAAMYFAIIFSGLYSLFLSSGLVFVVMMPAAFAFSILAAWRNVRLWYRQGEDYEQVLQEEAVQSESMRVSRMKPH